MSIDLFTFTRRIQPQAVLAVTTRLLRRLTAQPRRPEQRQRRSMNG